MLMILIVSAEPIEIDTIFAEGSIVGAVWFIGDGLRVKRSQVITLEDRATRLETEREEAAQKAVAEERRVIARELHDMVAHNVSVIVAQAAAAQRVYDARPNEGRTRCARSRMPAGRRSSRCAVSWGSCVRITIDPTCGSRNRAWATSRCSSRRCERRDSR